MRLIATQKMLQASLSLYEVVDKQMFSVPHGIGEECYPLAEDDDACLSAQEQIQLYVSVAEDEGVDVWMALRIVFRV